MVRARWVVFAELDGREPLHNGSIARITGPAGSEGYEIDDALRMHFGDHGWTLV